MAAFVTDQFRILNANSFVESINDNSYYAFLGLSNPTTPNPGFGRTSDWNTSINNNPIDNFQYLSHYRDTSLFGKKITSENVRRVVKRVDWISNTSYDMYRHDYSEYTETPSSKVFNLYNSNYYVITDEFKVYICLENGTSGKNPTNVPRSLFKPVDTSIEPPTVGSDGYRWKYLFTISPSDIIKFDSTEYFIVPNNWENSLNNEIVRIRDGGNSDIQNNQIKKVYIESGGSGYVDTTASILGDGSGGEVSITTTNGEITSVVVTSGGKGYTYGIVNLNSSSGTGAKLIPIIPPSKGHGYDIYKELGTDKVLIYARFDDSTKDFPTDTKFSQVGIIKNPETFSGVGITFTGGNFSSLYSIGITTSISINVGDKITQNQGNGLIAEGYVASFDTETKILKYYQDRSLSFGNNVDQSQTSIAKNIVPFNSSSQISIDGNSATVDTTLNNTSTINLGNKLINLGVEFTNGLANPEINKKTGDIIYIDNRPEVQRDSRQKEDVKIILEF